MTNSTEYETARKAHDVASSLFTELATRYSKGFLPEADFDKAYGIKKAADKVYDIAFNKEAGV